MTTLLPDDDRRSTGQNRKFIWQGFPLTIGKFAFPLPFMQQQQKWVLKKRMLNSDSKQKFHTLFSSFLAKKGEFVASGLWPT